MYRPFYLICMGTNSILNTSNMKRYLYGFYSQMILQNTAVTNETIEMQINFIGLTASLDRPQSLFIS